MSIFDLDIMNESASTDVSIPVPQKKEISADAYNKAIDALIKTFKEGVEVAETLKGATPVTEHATDVNLMDELIGNSDEYLPESAEDAVSLLFGAVFTESTSYDRNFNNKLKGIFTKDKIEKMSTSDLRGIANDIYEWLGKDAMNKFGDISDSASVAEKKKYALKTGEYLIPKVKALKPKVVNIIEQSGANNASTISNGMGKLCDDLVRVAETRCKQIKASLQ